MAKVRWRRWRAAWPFFVAGLCIAANIDLIVIPAVRIAIPAPNLQRAVIGVLATAEIAFIIWFFVFLARTNGSRRLRRLPMFFRYIAWRFNPERFRDTSWHRLMLKWGGPLILAASLLPEPGIRFVAAHVCAITQSWIMILALIFGNAVKTMGVVYVWNVVDIPFWLFPILVIGFVLWVSLDFFRWRRRGVFQGSVS